MNINRNLIRVIINYLANKTFQIEVESQRKSLKSQYWSLGILYNLYTGDLHIAPLALSQIALDANNTGLYTEPLNINLAYKKL